MKIIDKESKRELNDIIIYLKKSEGRDLIINLEKLNAKKIPSVSIKLPPDESDLIIEIEK